MSRRQHLTGLLSAGLLSISTPSNAAFLDSYFGWNFVGGSGPVAGFPVADLLAVTYMGGSGMHTFSPPTFPGFAGMPDGIGLFFAPTFAAPPPGSPGDGETTRTLGATVPIDWGATAAPFPDILIKEFVIGVPGLGTYTLDFGPSASTWYHVGLIPPPPATDDEICSTLFTPQGDIYDGAACILGNPVAGATIIGAPFLLDDHLGETVQVIFAAAAPPIVPIPASVWLFGSGLLGLVAVARRQRRES